ncbi:MAG: AsmA family protein [Pseudodesulfovibrio sp.]
MMRRFGLMLIELIGAAIVLAAIGLYMVSEYIDTEGFRQQFTSAVQTLTGQEVVLRGELNIALYPALSLEVHDLELREKPEAGSDSLVRFDDLLVSARLLPLASHQLKIRSIMVNGMVLNLSRLKEGEYNWRPLPSPASSAEGGSASAFFESVSLDGLEVANATIAYSDAVSGQKLQLSGIDLRTGSIADRDDIPFSAESHFSWKNGGVESTLTLSGLIARDDGNLVLKDASAYGSFGGAFLPRGADPAEVAAHVRVDLDKRSVELDNFRLHFLGLSGEGSVQSGDLGQGVSGQGQLTIRPFRPVDLVKRYFPKAPVGAVDGLKEGAFTSFVHFDENSVTLKDMAAVLDGMTVRGSIAMKHFSLPQFSFDLRADMVDLDRYLPLFRTDTPFVWGDYQLEAFRSFRGSGRVRADAFKVLGTVINDIRLNVKADGKTILADAGALRKGQGSLAGTAKFMLGSDGNVTTLGAEADLTAESLKSGFDFLHVNRAGLTGPGVLKLAVRAPSMRCPVEERSINILRRATVDGSLELGPGKGSWKTEGGGQPTQSYDSAGLAFKIKPAASAKAGFFGLGVDASLRGRGGAPLDSFLVAASGPLLLDVDGGRVESPGLDVRAQLSGKLVTEFADRMTAVGRVSFDSTARTLGAENVELRVLETLAKGNVRVDGSGKRFKAAGKLDVPQADARRIIFLLTGEHLALNDPMALKQVGLSTAFAVSDTGFTLSDLRGVLDGMPVSGLVVGQGLADPILAVSLNAGKFDLDRYLPSSRKPTLTEIRSGKVKKSPPAKLPLDVLRALRINGKAAFEEFTLARIRTTGLTGAIKAEKGDLHVAGLNGNLYGGALSGDLGGKVGPRSMTVQVKLQVAKMQAAPLMMDLAEREYVRGETDVDVNLMSGGATDEDILANLDGVCSAVIRQGSFKFTGYDAQPTTTKTDGSRDTAATDPKLRRTAFSRTTASFAVKKGVFNVESFRLESPLLNSSGTGWFSLPDNRIELAVKNDFVAVPSVTINVVGKLSDPEVNVPKGKILDNTVRNILSLPQKSFKFLRDLFM